MSRFRAIVAEFDTGIVRRPDSPATRYLKGESGADSRVFDREDQALQFKNQILEHFSDLEVIVRPERATHGGIRFYLKSGVIVGENLD